VFILQWIVLLSEIDNCKICCISERIMGEQVASLNHHSLYHEYENNYEKDEAAEDGAVKEGRSDMLTFQVVRVVVVF